MNHSPFNELNSWINSLLKKRNGNVNQFTFFGEWWIEFPIHFQFILKKKNGFLNEKGEVKTLFIHSTNTTNANCLLAGLTYTYSLQPATSPKEMRQNHCKITSEKWIENELKKNDSFSNEWWIELIHLFSKWMVNWIDSLFFEMNGELNDSPKNGEWTQVLTTFIYNSEL